MKKHTEVIWDLFVNRTDRWSRQYVKRDELGQPQLHYSARGFDRQPLPALTEEHIQSHLDGNLTIAVPAVSTEGTGKWLCIDADKRNSGLEEAEKWLRDIGLTPHRESQRADRDGHLWILLDQSIPIIYIYNFLALLRASVFGDRDLVASGLEFYPKTATGITQVRLPLGVHLKPGAGKARGYFSEAEPTLEAQLAFLAGLVRDDHRRILRLAELYHSLTPTPKPKPVFPPRRQRETIADLRPYIGEYRQVGKELIAACPLCQLEGADNHGDNLRLSLDGSKVNCVKNGPNQHHKTSEIYAFFSE